LIFDGLSSKQLGLILVRLPLLLEVDVLAGPAVHFCLQQFEDVFDVFDLEGV
jgi:hypothetical protein